ncbi:MAG: PEP-CTERM sorting domain-containing protein [Fimbriimonadales bacterium]
MKTFRLLTLAGLAVAAVSANALTLVTTRAGIGATDTIDWGQFGAAFTSLGTPINGVTSTYGLRFRASTTATAAFERRDQWTGGWAGNFTQGDELLWTKSPGVTTIRFASYVQAVGANIQDDFFGPFTATIEAFDGFGVSMGSFQVNGNSNSNNDGSAIFVGVASNAFNIAKITYQVQGASGALDDFAINEVAMNACVPEPGTIAALGLGAIALIRRKRSK